MATTKLRTVLCRKCNTKMEWRCGEDDRDPLCSNETPIPYARWFCTDSDCGYAITHPEFLPLVNEMARQIQTTINAGAPHVVSPMPYKCQYTLELLIEILEESV